ncbi:hypothetical protein [Trueperella pyogenes]|uniref:hypothetical protein n=1 Tax=Trueperella pyogenes TaxID=1661 RepID=UPI00324FAE71
MRASQVDDDEVGVGDLLVRLGDTIDPVLGRAAYGIPEEVAVGVGDGDRRATADGGDSAPGRRHCARERPELRVEAVRCVVLGQGPPQGEAPVTDGVLAGEDVAVFGTWLRGGGDAARAHAGVERGPSGD